MRNADRAMSNIESHPEGFNMLRRMYENIQVSYRSTNMLAIPLPVQSFQYQQTA